MTISIIIAVKTWQKNLEDCVAKCQELDYPDFEIIILPDEPIYKGDSDYLKNRDRHHFSKTEDSPKMVSVPIFSPIFVPTGPVSPAHKRDIALKHAKGEILAFLDDDAYPRKDWLKNAAKNFTDPEVAAVGGPAITPESDNLKQKASGRVYASILVSGKYRYRYVPGERQEVDDYPSCNLLVRKSVMEALGGFNTSFWPGEDTKLCLDITKKLKKKIIYDPEVLVWHHRRPLFSAHLKQIASYALHRGYFVKRFPETSLRLAYFIPSLFLFALIFGAGLSLWVTPLKILYFCGLFLYSLLVIIFSIQKDLRLIPMVFCGIIFTHVYYGFYFIKGLFLSKLKEEL